MSGRLPVNTAVVVVAATATAVVLAVPGPGNAPGSAPRSRGYELTGRVVDGPRSTGGKFALSGTLTRGAAPTMKGASYALTGGPWAAAGTATSSQAAPLAQSADYNADGSVDERDLVLALTRRSTVDEVTVGEALEVLGAWGATR